MIHLTYLVTKWSWCWLVNEVDWTLTEAASPGLSKSKGFPPCQQKRDQILQNAWCALRKRDLRYSSILFQETLILFSFYPEHYTLACGHKKNVHSNEIYDESLRVLCSYIVWKRCITVVLPELSLDPFDSCSSERSFVSNTNSTFDNSSHRLNFGIY